MKTIRCAIRKVSVAAHPEELVRQELLSLMTAQLGYPSSLIAVEKELALLPHLKLNPSEIPDRRADILCFGKGIHPDFELYPLLLVECKAVTINSKVINQVVGYNHFVKSYFIGVANQEEIRTGWYDNSLKRYQFVPFLPTYQELIQNVTKSLQPMN